MPDFKSLAKGGWHPSIDDKVHISRSNLKNPRGWVGKSEDSKAADRAREHVAAPLSSLKDPASFAPPPKHVHYHGAEAIAGSSSSSSSQPTNTHVPTVYKDTHVYDTDRGGLGGPVSSTTLQRQRDAERREEQDAEKPKPPPVPYRVDTTGLKTNHLPPPPVRRNVDGVTSPSPATPPRNTASPARPAQPNLPPRLPQRQNSNPNEFTAPPPPSYGEATATSPQPSAAARPANPVSELQSRFAGLKTTNTPPPTAAPQSNSQPLSWSRASSAVATAQQAHKDPGSVSFAQAREAASTANQVNRQYGAQIGQGLRAANQFTGGSVGGSNATAATAVAAAAKKKPPPPPPGRHNAGGEGAPPVPMGSKPRG